MWHPLFTELRLDLDRQLDRQPARQRTREAALLLARDRAPSWFRRVLARKPSVLPSLAATRAERSASSTGRASRAPRLL